MQVQKKTSTLIQLIEILLKTKQAHDTKNNVPDRNIHNRIIKIYYSRYRFIIIFNKSQVYLQSHPEVI